MCIRDRTWPDLGYALLVKRYQTDMSKVTEEDIKKAAVDTVPNVAPLFWAFRVMVAVGMYLILFFGVAFWLASRGRLDTVSYTHLLGRVALDRGFHRAQVDAGARMRGHFQRLQAVAFQRLQRAVEGGGLDDDRVARLRHRLQAQVERCLLYTSRCV